MNRPATDGRAAVTRPAPPLPGPLPAVIAWPAVGRCVVATAVMLARRRLWQPVEHVGRSFRFADGTSALVYRETRVDRTPPADPCLLLVTFRLRRVRGAAHAAFERESVLNTLLFAGFPGLVSKLWLGHDERERYRGLYEWDGPHLADTYARSLWRVLALVSERGSIDFRVLAGVHRDDLLADPARSLGARPGPGPWWRVTASSPPPAAPARLSVVRDGSRRAARGC